MKRAKGDYVKSAIVSCHSTLRPFLAVVVLSKTGGAKYKGYADIDKAPEGKS